MTGVRFINVLDVARAFGERPADATPENIANWLLNEYLGKQGGSFNYNTATNAAIDLYSGDSTFTWALRYCESKGNPKGRRANVDAITCVGPYILEHPSRCYRIGFTAVVAGRLGGRNIYVGIKAPLVRVEGERAFLVMPGFRMSHRPVEAEIDLACSIALANLARDDYASADFEYLYAGPGISGQRQFRAIHGRDRSVFDRDAVDALLDVYVKGVALALKEGAAAYEPDLTGYRIIDPRESSLF